MGELHTSSPSHELQVQLEIAGIDLSSFEAYKARTMLLMPIGLRTVGTDEEGHLVSGDDLLAWDRIELREVKGPDSPRCLWDFINLTGAPAEALLRFVQTWGLLDFGDDAAYMLDIEKEGWSELSEWRRLANEIRAMLFCIVKTGEGELVGEDILETLREGDPYDPGPPPPRLLKRGISLHTFSAWGRDRKKEHWQAERRAGRGLDLQRTIAMNLLLGWINPLDIVPTWDESGLHVVTEARGAKEIIGTELLAIFTTPQFDVFICSICQRPYPLSIAEGSRRPRLGTRRLCSESCRRAAKRIDDLKSWHSNKHKWSSGRERRREHGQAKG